MECPICHSMLDETNTCPNCGYHLVIVKESVKAVDGYGCKKKDKSIYHSKNHTYFEEVIDRPELNYDLGQYVHRYKKEDRINHKYEEVVKTFDGKVIHKDKTSLLNHRGHGNDKKRDDDNEV